MSKIRTYHVAKTTLMQEDVKLELLSDLNSLPLGALDVQLTSHFHDAPGFIKIVLDKSPLMVALRKCKSSLFRYMVAMPRNYYSDSPRFNPLPSEYYPSNNGELSIMHKVMCDVSNLVDKVIGDWLDLKRYFDAPGYHLCSWFFVQPAWPLINEIYFHNSEDSAVGYVDKNASFAKLDIHPDYACSDSKGCSVYRSGSKPAIIQANLPFDTPLFPLDADGNNKIKLGYCYPLLNYRREGSVESNTYFMWTTSLDCFPFLFVEFGSEHSNWQVANNVNIESLELQVHVNSEPYPLRLVPTKSEYVWLMLLNDRVYTEEDCAQLLSAYMRNPMLDYTSQMSQYSVTSNTQMFITILELTQFYVTPDHIGHSTFTDGVVLDEIEDLYSGVPEMAFYRDPLNNLFEPFKHQAKARNEGVLREYLNDPGIDDWLRDTELIPTAPSPENMARLQSIAKLAAFYQTPN